MLAQVVCSGDRAAQGDSISSVAQKIKGMIFLGTPFYGPKIAGWGEVVRRIYSLVQKTDQKTLRNLTLDSKELKDLRLGFPEVIRKRNQTSAKIAVVFFFEKKTTYKVVCIESQTPTDAGY